jgi:hypothetical protein
VYTYNSQISSHIHHQLFNEVKITERILNATRLNSHAIEQPKGLRLGYMGHLTLLTSHLLAFLNNNPEICTALQHHLTDESWQEHISKSHRETVEICEKPLGGTAASEGVDTRTDQLARFMIQQVMGHMPDKFGSHEQNEDDDEATWAYAYIFRCLLVVNLSGLRPSWRRSERISSKLSILLHSRRRRTNRTTTSPMTKRYILNHIFNIDGSCWSLESNGMNWRTT